MEIKQSVCGLKSICLATLSHFVTLVRVKQNESNNLNLCLLQETKFEGMSLEYLWFLS